MKINGFEVYTDTPDELLTLTGPLRGAAPERPSEQRALPPISMPLLSPSPSPHPLKVPSVADVADSKAPSQSTRTHHKKGALPEHLKSMSEFWGALSPKVRECIELRAAGDDNQAIAAKTGKTVGSVSVTINLGRRRLEAARDAAASVGKLKEPDDDGEGDDDDEPEPEPGEPEAEEPGATSKLDVVEEGSSFGNAGGNSLFAYMKAVRAHPILTREREHEIATEFARTRDPKLAHALVRANLRFVIKLALGCRQDGSKLVDLIQEGNMGLMHAVQKFDPASGFKLTTYAKHWIGAYLKRFIMKDKRLVRVGKTNRERMLFWSLSRTRERLRQEIGAEPSSEDIAAALKVTVADVQAMTMRLSEERDIELRSGNDGDESAPRDWIPDGKPLPDEVAEREEAREKLHALLLDLRRSLNPRMLHILDARLLAEEPVRLEDIAVKYGVSRERVRQLEERLKEKIRRRLESTLRAVA